MRGSLQSSIQDIMINRHDLKLNEDSSITNNLSNSLANFDTDLMKEADLDNSFKYYKFDEKQMFNTLTELPKQSNKMIQANENHVVSSLQSLQYLSDNQGGTPFISHFYLDMLK